MYVEYTGQMYVEHTGQMYVEYTGQIYVEYTGQIYVSKSVADCISQTYWSNSLDTHTTSVNANAVYTN
jgi:hypothetical protein